MADNWCDSSSRTRPCLDPVSVSNLFQDTQTVVITTTTTTTHGRTNANASLHMMGLGVPSQALSQSLDWNQALFQGDQDNFHLDNNQWRPQKMYLASSQDSSSGSKQYNITGFQLDQPPQGSDNESATSCQGLNSSFQNMDLYGSHSTILMQNLFGLNNNHQQQEDDDSSFNQNQGICYSLYQSNYGNQLQMELPLSSFEDNPKITSKLVKVTSESTKRPRNEDRLTLPVFKVKKEKMGDRITALQQLLSPFGKTDTASVLSETTEYIKFLHEQVSVLSTPYMRNGAPILQHQETRDEPSSRPRQDLRSRGLCLVPVSSTFPVTRETRVDLWTPTFGGTFR
ncbi:hypothetical protein L1987_74051 [Smallanthus sonchifolius]|uniref:Uncharacterized protein n=1 Tax=Smallanthus sonchifolius TaxID=185202 RepID=A0ACB9A630_9ASTR|nr:hypothetical protein L1987_74051 [Smallanthus sonchifolius]